MSLFSRAILPDFDGTALATGRGEIVDSATCAAAMLGCPTGTDFHKLEVHFLFSMLNPVGSAHKLSSLPHAQGI